MICDGLMDKEEGPLVIVEDEGQPGAGGSVSPCPGRVDEEEGHPEAVEGRQGAAGSLSPFLEAINDGAGEEEEDKEPEQEEDDDEDKTS